MNKVGTSVIWAAAAADVIPIVVRLTAGAAKPMHCVQLQRLGDTILGLVPSMLLGSLEDDETVLSVGLVSQEVL